MRISYFLGIIVALVAMAFSDYCEALDIGECMRVAGKMHDTPSQMTIADLDALSLCAHTLRQAMVEGARVEREARNIGRSMGLKDDE